MPRRKVLPCAGAAAGAATVNSNAISSRLVIQ
jgi:hypothetical protein